MLDVEPVRRGVGRVGRLHGQRIHPLQQGLVFIQTGSRLLHQRNRVLGVALSLVKTIDAGQKTLADAQAGRVVRGAVDAKP